MRFRSIPIEKLSDRALPREPSPELRRVARELLVRSPLPPVSVLELPEGGFEVIDGERRLRAHQLVGDQSVPALILGTSD